MHYVILNRFPHSVAYALILHAGYAVICNAATIKIKTATIHCGFFRFIPFTNFLLSQRVFKTQL